MTQNEKDLLLQDICSRLPYGVNCKIYHKYRYYDMKLSGVFDNEAYFTDENGSLYIDYENVKPYLFPMSSMTEEHKRELSNICKCLISFTDWEICFPNYEDNNIGNWQKVVSWMYKNHYDINGLIPSGLAIDATGKNIY